MVNGNDHLAWRSAAKVDSSGFDSVSFNGISYAHNILIPLAGGTARREKRLFTGKCGISHRVLRRAAEFNYGQRCTPLSLDAPPCAKVLPFPEAAESFGFRDWRMTWQPAPDPVESCKKVRVNANILGSFRFTC